MAAFSARTATAVVVGALLALEATGFRSPFYGGVRSSVMVQRQAASVSDPPSFASVIKDNPIEWYDNSMSYGVFNWGLNSVGDMQRTLRKVPLFPLNIVGSPGATRQLRIFEPRYRQMFQDLFSEKTPYNRTFGLVLTEGKGIASVGCLMHVEVMQYENQRTDRFITFNRAVDRFKLVRLSTPTSEVPYIVADAEIGYEDIPLFQRMIPECDILEQKVEFLVRDMLAYLIRWECKAIEKERMASLEPLAARVLKYSAQNRAILPKDLSEAKRRQLFVWSVVDLLSVGLQINELQLMLQLRDIHARLTILYEVTQRTHQYIVRGDSVLLDLMSTRLFRS